MENILVDLRELDLSTRLGKDTISVDDLLRELEYALDKIETLEEEIRYLETPKERDDDMFLYED